MDNLKTAWNAISLLLKFWPIIILPLVFGFIRLCVTDGIKYALKILARLLIALLCVGVATTIIIFLI